MRSLDRIMYTLAIVTAASLPAALASAKLSPATVYCQALGYRYVVAETPLGARGLCQLPGDRLVDANKFYLGLVATDVNYCGIQGYQTRHYDVGPLCVSCAVCVLPDTSEVPVGQAMGLSFRESRCGDGHCGTVENHGNCPADCASGSYDEVCDGVADGICDRDCVDLQQNDPDCKTAEPNPTPPGGDAKGCGCRASSGTVSGALSGLWAMLVLGARRRPSVNRAAR
jgi:putative hemolysin